MRRAVLAGVLAAALAGAIVAVAAGGGGDTDGGRGGQGGPLRWSGKVLSFQHPTLETDHVVSGKVRLEALEPLRLVARDDITAVAADGTELPTSAVFTQTFGHGLFDPTRLPEARLPERELMRIGDVGRLRPGDEIPLTVSWRERDGAPRASRIAYPGGSLPIPG
jgi:hypothetical protein